MAMADTQTAGTFDPYASIRQRVLAQVSPEDASAVPSAPTTDAPAAPDFAASPAGNPVGQPIYTATASTDTQQPSGASNDGTPAPAATSQPAAVSTPIPNPYDTTNPANQGTGGTYNQPAPGNVMNELIGYWSSYLGRDPSASDQAYLMSLVNAGQSTAQIQNMIANSPEAMAYAKSKGFGQPNPSSTPAAPSAPASTGTSAVTASPTSDFTNQLRALLMQRLQSASAPVDENSPQIQAALQAARDEATRTSDQERTALAEQLYAQGVGGGAGPLQSNAITQGIQQSAERNAGALSTLRANLLMNAYNQKNQELQNDLQLAFASGDAESARQIQIQIANLQATIQREGIGAGLAINAANQNATTVNAGA